MLSFWQENITTLFFCTRYLNHLIFYMQGEHPTNYNHSDICLRYGLVPSSSIINNTSRCSECHTEKKDEITCFTLFILPSSLAAVGAMTCYFVTVLWDSTVHTASLFAVVSIRSNWAF